MVGPDRQLTAATKSSSTYVPAAINGWIEVSASEPDLRVHIYVDLTDVADGELLEGSMHVTGQLQEGIEPFETRFRFEFHDEVDETDATRDPPVAPRTPDGPSEDGWLGAFAKLDAMLNGARAGSAPVVEV